jgi:hypothetical protein
MYTVLVDFFSKRLVIAALLASVLWFYAGYQYVAKGKQIIGVAWQLIGVFLLGAFCIHAALYRGWYSLIIALAGVTAELWLIQRGWRDNHQPHS